MGVSEMRSSEKWVKARHDGGFIEIRWFLLDVSRPLDVTRIEQAIVSDMKKTIIDVQIKHNPITGRLD